MAALIQAVKQGSIRGILLVVQGIQDRDGSFQTEAGTTPLIEACKFGDKKTGVQMVKVLLDNRAEISRRDYLGLNAFHWACSKAHKEIVDLFIKSNQTIDFNARDNNGNSVLYHAVTSSDCRFTNYICRLYEEHGGNVEMKNNQGFSAVDLALKLGHNSCAVVVNRASGRRRVVNSKGHGDLNCCMLNWINGSVGENHGFAKRCREKCKGKRFTASEEPRFNSYKSVNRSRKSKFLSLSNGDLTLKDQGKLPSLAVGQKSLISMYGRHRSQTEPVRHHELKSDLLPRKNGFFNGERLPIIEQNRLPNTCKDLLVDFNLIYSVENTPSYRKGFSKPKEKSKIVTFSDSIESGQEKEDEKRNDEKIGKNKISRKLSRINNDTKVNGTFISKGKEQKKSRKSRDEV